MKLFHKLTLSVSLLAATTVMAPNTSDANYYLNTRQGKVDVSVGAGLTFDSPIHFALELAGEYFLTNNIGLGVAFDTWIRSPHVFIFRPFVRYHFDLSRFPKWVPYAGLGIGGGGASRGGGFMAVAVPNVGVKYALTNRIHLGTDMNLYILTDFNSSNVDFQWLVANVSFRF